MTKRVAGYTRVSTPEQAEADEVSLTEQEDAIRDWCKGQGHELTAIYSDPGVSGTTGDRPGFKRLLSDVEHGLFDLVVVWKSSRLFRNGLLAYRVKEALDVSDTAIRSVTDSLGVDTLGLFAWLGERERENLISQMMLGKFGAARKNKWTGGRLPYGYAVNDTLDYVIDPEQAPVLRMIYRLAADGETNVAIASHLTRLGIKTKYGLDYWSHKTIRDLLRNDVYHTGEMEVLTKLTKRGNRPPIYNTLPVLIAPETAHAARSARHKPDSLASFRGELEGATSRALLKRRMTCGCGCGYAFTTAIRRRKYVLMKTGEAREYNYVYYVSHVSRVSHLKGCCANQSLRFRVDALDTAVWDALCGALADRDTLRRFIEAHASQSNNDREQIAHELAAIRKIRSDVERKRAELLEIMVDPEHPLYGTLPPEMLKEKADIWTDQLKSARVEIDRLEQKLAALPLEDVEDILSQIQTSLLEGLASPEDLGPLEAAYEQGDAVNTVGAWQGDEFDLVDLTPEVALSGLMGEVTPDIATARRQLIDRLDIVGTVYHDRIEFSGTIPIPAYTLSKSFYPTGTKVSGIPKA